MRFETHYKPNNTKDQNHVTNRNDSSLRTKLNPRLHRNAVCPGFLRNDKTEITKHMNITFDHGGLTVTATVRHDRRFGYMIEEFHVSMDGEDMQGNLTDTFLNRLETKVLEQAKEQGVYGW